MATPNSGDIIKDEAVAVVNDQGEIVGLVHRTENRVQLKGRIEAVMEMKGVAGSEVGTEVVISKEIHERIIDPNDGFSLKDLDASSGEIRVIDQEGKTDKS